MSIFNREYALHLSVRLITVGVVIILCLPSTLAAQTSDTTTQSQEQKKEDFTSQAAEPTAPRSRIGNFLITPYLDVGQLYDDNIFALPFAEIDDMVTVINPSVSIKSDWQLHQINMDAWASIGRYHEYDQENYEDYGLSGDFRYDLATKSNIFGSLGYKKAHEDRSSPDESFGFTPTFYSRIDAALGMSHNFGSLWTRLGVTRDAFDFDNNESRFGPINNDDRDRNMDAAGIRLGYPVATKVDLFAQATYDRRAYDDTPDDNGYVRNSDGSRLAAGVIVNPGRGLNIELLAGSLRQNYEDPRFSNISTPDYGADLIWRPSRASRFSLLLDRTLEETTLAGASSYLNDMISTRVDHQLQYNLSVSAYGALSQLDYQGIERTDDLVSAGFGIKYSFSKPFFLALDYDFLRRDSTDEIADYYRNNVFLSVGVNGLDSTIPALLAPLSGQENESPGGLYAGAQIGHAAITADYGGPRGPGLDGTFLETGLVANAPAWRLFGGYGHTFDRLYLGAEIEVETADSELKFTREVNRRNIRIARDNAVGLSARVGYVNDSKSLLYTRLGAMRTEYQTDYAFQDVAVSNDNILTGFQAGLGVEVPLSKYLGWRMDYTWRDYPGIEIDYELGSDSVEMDESVFNLGLAVNFGGTGLSDESTNNDQMDRFSGLYLGGQIGHGVTFTDFEGRRGPADQGGSVSTVLGNDGFIAGGIGGFGAQFKRFYLGFEVELDAAMSQWRFDRQENVRTITVDKRETAGAVVRVGYTLADRALLYAGAGLVNTRFETRYVFRDVLEIINKRVHGTRLVLGTEVPVTDDFSWRFEYSYTDYNAYSTVEETTDEFDINETLFRLAGIVRF